MINNEQNKNLNNLNQEEQVEIAARLEEKDQFYRTGLGKNRMVEFQELALQHNIKSFEEFNQFLQKPNFPSDLEKLKDIYSELISHDQNIRLEVLHLLDKNFNSKFPSLLSSPQELVNAIWLIFQHGDTEFLEKGLNIMIESKKRNVRNIELWRIAQMADRLCVYKFGYGLFGTQQRSDLKNYEIPKIFKGSLLNQIQVLINHEIPEEIKTETSINEMKEIWQKIRADPALELANSSLVDFYIKKFSN